MEQILFDLFGANWETLAGISFPLLGVLGLGVSRFIKNKAIGQAITKVTGFFTSDLTPEEQTELGGIAKNFLSRKQLKALNKIVGFLGEFDTDKVKLYLDYAKIGFGALLSTMYTNGAFDENPELKSKIEMIVGVFLA